METTSFSVEYDRIFNNDDIRGKFNEFGQFMIVDSGCPRSLMGDKEYIKLKKLFNIKKLNVKGERFKFGPSRLYQSEFKVRFPMQLGEASIEVEFFVVKGDIPILLGNDTRGLMQEGLGT